jgi:hypothetical protein
MTGHPGISRPALLSIGMVLSGVLGALFVRSAPDAELLHTHISRATTSDNTPVEPRPVELPVMDFMFKTREPWWVAALRVMPGGDARRPS